MKRLFGNLKMSWLTVILFAIVTGVYTGFIMLIPILENTSFQDIGISYEWWVIFAVIVVVNCDKAWEAMLKCFVFFLISQPLVYAVEVVFGSLSLEQAKYYYFGIWLPMTFLTLPGGLIAYFCKKQNVIGGVILGLGNTIQAIHVLAYFGMAMRNFPHHLLSGIVSIVSIIVMTLCIQEEKKNRLVVFLTIFVMLVVILVLLKVSGRVLF
ncbi:MAG: hypothetical protein Q4E53_05675 [Eubacteriales bacterium]|nr:hypothetical protein [Eubacteriales bacterium]